MLNIQSSRARLRALGLRPRKSLSQSFLDDQHVAAAIVRAAELDAARDVLEVGPGLGVLTERLARVARRVVAIEIDPLLAEWLRTELTGGNIRWSPPTCCRSSRRATSKHRSSWWPICPTTSPRLALRHLLNAGPPFAVAPGGHGSGRGRRAHRRPRRRHERAGGDHSGPGRGQRSCSACPASAFYPRPKVDSAVLLMEPFAESDRANLARRAGRFHEAGAGRLQAAAQEARELARRGTRRPKEVATEPAGTVGIDPSLRPQALAVADWVRLYRST